MATEISYSNFRKNLKSFFDEVNDNSSVITIKRRNSESAVLLSKADYDNLVENLHVRSNPIAFEERN